MKDLMMLARECMEELDCLGIEYAKNIQWEINSRAKSRWGQCERKNGGKLYIIQISSQLLQDYLPNESPKQTIIHELLHSVEGCMSHTGKWKELAELVTDCYGCYEITRCTSAEELGVKENIIAPTYKYIFKCKGCGQIIKRQKASKFTKYYDRYRCGACHGRFEMI